MLEQSFYRIAGLREAIRRLASPGELDGLLGCLDGWFTAGNFLRIRFGVGSHGSSDVGGFLASLRTVADDFASTTVNIDSILAQLGAGATEVT